MERNYIDSNQNKGIYNNKIIQYFDQVPDIQHMNSSEQIPSTDKKRPAWSTRSPFIGGL